ncbi:MAG TPA: WD40 repeat domain-containing protein, partial [Polyangia bacterium]|nr:WD40 repeat domain-containing protein [Polyangia bacterium]
SFDPSGHFLVTASYDNTARLWSATGQDYLLSLHHEQVVWWVGYGADGQHVLTVSGAPEREVRIWDTARGKAESSFGSLPGNANYGGWSRDRRTFLVAVNETALFLDAATGHPQAQIRHGAPINSVAFSPDETRIVVADQQGKAAIYDRQSGRALTWLPGDATELYFTRFDREGRRVVTAGKDQTAKVWDAASGALLASLHGHRGAVLGAAFHPDGKRLVTAALDQTAKVWLLPEGQLLYTAQEHRRQLNAVDFNPDGTLFVTAGFDEKVRIWDTATGAPVGAFPAFRAEWADFSSDGTRLAVADEDGRLIVWPMGLDRRRPDEISRFVRCHIPFRVADGRLLPAETDPTACAGAP